MSDPTEPTRVDTPSVAPDPTLVGQPAVGYEDGGPPGPVDRTGGPPPPPDRRPWIIAAILALIVLVLILLLLLQDDDDEGDVSTTATTTSSVTSSTSSTSVPETTTTAAVTTTEASAVTVPPEDCAELGENPATPGLASETVYDAWVRGDEACAAELMTPAALAELFSRDGTGATDEFQGCTQEEEPDPHADCAYTYPGGTTHYLMNYSDTEGWKVFDVTQVPD